MTTKTSSGPRKTGLGVSQKISIFKELTAWSKNGRSAFVNGETVSKIMCVSTLYLVTV